MRVKSSLPSITGYFCNSHMRRVKVPDKKRNDPSVEKSREKKDDAKTRKRSCGYVVKTKI